jgi:SAM-dependent methyltransferase
MGLTPFDYWADGHGLGNITPPGNPWPEGEKFKLYYPDLFFGQDVIEFGCGVGRLAPFFSKKRYVGIDICASAITQARMHNRGYEFYYDNGEGPITVRPERVEHVAFAHNVMMHIPDEALPGTIGRFVQKRIIISEVLGRNWRREGDPPVFNREIEEYERAGRAVGYRLHSVKFKPGENYRRAGKMVDFGIMEFHRDATSPA